MGVADDGLWDWNLADKTVFFDRRYYMMAGYEPNSFPHHFDEWFKRVHPDDIHSTQKSVQDYLQGHLPMFDVEFRFLRQDGTWMWIRGRGKIVERDSEGTVTRIVGTHTDITERKRAEEEGTRLREQLVQSQKMESVGRLAGGVAHDFNNMLGVILGYTDMALKQLSPHEGLYGDLQEVRKAAQRSADLTRQLLAFARKQTVAPQIVNLNTIVEGMLKMLRRLIGEDIELVWLPAKTLPLVKMDPSQVDQVLANLCVNARDAIGDTGRVTIETTPATLGPEYCADHLGAVPGEYVMLTVSDTGCGMDHKTIENLFEPFFTTKEVGKGTGLGLATVYGIVKQNNGYIDVYSELGHGTTFKIYLPRHAEKSGSNELTRDSEHVVTGNEVILVVEDEPTILRLASRMLGNLGYVVLSASTPGEAIRLAEDHAGDIHLLMTDVVMPEMNGRDLAKRLLSLYPRMKRLFMSGYTADVIAHHGVLEEGVHFIPKPFTIEDLSDRVRSALDAR